MRRTRPFPLFLAAAAAARLLSAQQPPQKDTASFEGFVQDAVSRLPPARASVRLIPLSSNHPSYSATTEPYGTFHFEAIDPGEYRIEAKARGFAPANSVALQPGRAVSILSFRAGQQINAAAVVLEPEAVIAGRVLDSEGAPLGGAAVNAISEQWRRGFRVYEAIQSTETDERGAFRLGIPAGRYYFSAGPKRSNLLPSIFVDNPGNPPMFVPNVLYPNANSIDRATPLQVGPGLRPGEIGFRLPAVAANYVRGVVKGLPAPGAETFVLLRHRNGERFAVTTARIRKDASFEFPAVLPGAYWLELFSPRGGVRGRTPLEIAGRSVDGVDVAASRPFELRARVRCESENSEPLTAIRFRLDMLDAFQPVRHEAGPQADGTLVFRDVTAGVYALTGPADADLYIASVSQNGRPVEGNIDLSRGSAGELEIVLGTGAGQVTGNVKLPPPVFGAPLRPAEPVTAVLVSKNGVTGNTGLRSASIGLTGLCEFRFVPPGRYIAFAVEDLDEDLWQNMDFVKTVEGRGIALELAGKATAQVELPILTADEVRVAVERLPR